MATKKENLQARATELGIPIRAEDGIALTISQLEKAIMAAESLMGNDTATNAAPVEPTAKIESTNGATDDAAIVESLLESILPDDTADDGAKDTTPDDTADGAADEEKPRYTISMDDHVIVFDRPFGQVVIDSRDLNERPKLSDSEKLRDDLRATMRANGMPDAMIDMALSAMTTSIGTANAPDHALAVDDVLYATYRMVQRAKELYDEATAHMDAAIKVYNAGLHDKKRAIVRNHHTIAAMRGVGAPKNRLTNEPDGKTRKERTTSTRATIRELIAHADANGYVPQVQIDDVTYTLRINSLGAAVLVAPGGQNFASANQAQASHLGVNSERNVHSVMRVWNGAEWLTPDTKTATSEELAAFYAEVIAAHRS